jgi:hypothetical protein
VNGQFTTFKGALDGVNRTSPADDLPGNGQTVKKQAIWQEPGQRLTKETTRKKRLWSEA